MNELGGEVVANIEVKTPRTLAIRPNYDSERLAEILSQKIEGDFNSGFQNQHCSDYIFISSFDHNWLSLYKEKYM